MTDRRHDDRRDDEKGQSANPSPSPNPNRQGAAYQGALEAVFSILIGAGIGYWADGRLGTKPWLLLLGFVLGFGAFALRMMRLARQLREGTEGQGPGER